MGLSSENHRSILLFLFFCFCPIHLLTGIDQFLLDDICFRGVIFKARHIDCALRNLRIKPLECPIHPVLRKFRYLSSPFLNAKKPHSFEKNCGAECEYSVFTQVRILPVWPDIS